MSKWRPIMPSISLSKKSCGVELDVRRDVLDWYLAYTIVEVIYRDDKSDGSDGVVTSDILECPLSGTLLGYELKGCMSRDSTTATKSASLIQSPVLEMDIVGVGVYHSLMNR